MSSKADNTLVDTVSAIVDLPADSSSMPLKIDRENLLNKIDTDPGRQSDKNAGNSGQGIQETEEKAKVSNDQADQSKTQSSLVNKLTQMAKPASKTQQGETVHSVQYQYSVLDLYCIRILNHSLQLT